MRTLSRRIPWFLTPSPMNWRTSTRIMIVRVEYNLVLLCLCLTVIVIKVGYKCQCYIYNLWSARRLFTQFHCAKFKLTSSNSNLNPCQSIGHSPNSRAFLNDRSKPYSTWSWRSSLTFSRTVNNGGFAPSPDSNVQVQSILKTAPACKN